MNKNIYGFMFVFDISDKKSLVDSISYLKEIQAKENEQNQKSLSFKTKKLLVGTKYDLHTKKHINFVKAYTKNLGIKFIETSSLQNFNVSEAFEDLCRDIYFEGDIEKFEREMKMNIIKNNSFDEKNDEDEYQLVKSNQTKLKKILIQFGCEKQNNQKYSYKGDYDLEEFQNCEFVQLDNFKSSQNKKKKCLIFQSLILTNYMLRYLGCALPIRQDSLLLFFWMLSFLCEISCFFHFLKLEPKWSDFF